MENRFSGMSDEGLQWVMKSARMDAENAIRSRSPGKMILYNMAEKTYLEAHAEYCRRREG